MVQPTFQQLISQMCASTILTFLIHVSLILNALESLGGITLNDGSIFNCLSDISQLASLLSILRRNEG